MPKLDPAITDKLTSMDADWPQDPAVPELPPIPDAVNPPPPKDNYLWKYYNDHTRKPRAMPPRPLTDIVNEEAPLEADVCWSMRSPYSYLTLNRLTWLHSNYNVNINIRVIFPVAVRTRHESGKAGSGRWYKMGDALHDTHRTGKYEGVPFKYPYPDPIWQNEYPPESADNAIHPLEKQPYIGWLTRLGNYAELQGKGIHYVHAVSSLIWGGHADHWPDHVKERFNSIDGLDYDTAIQNIREHTEEVDAVWQKNQMIQLNAGHGGVPLMIFQGEPFFGQDRFNQFYWRLRQSGLTRRDKPRAPSTVKPLHWPDGE
jgi:2-hydroxychromene-2-carboxylate isomerase